MRWFICLLMLGASVFGSAWAAAANAQLRPWDEYRAIMWMSDTAYKKPEKLPLFFQRLREMGIDTGMVHNDGRIAPLVEAGFPYYVENLVNRGLCLKFHSKVTDWEKFVTEWSRNGRPESAFVRDYSLVDPAWLKWATNEMATLVRKNMTNQPLAYDIRDELSVTISANPFDYDFSPTAQEGFRKWLQEVYGSLGALNEEWGTSYASWAEVRPWSTDRIKHRMGSGKALPEGKMNWGDVTPLKFHPRTARENLVRWNFAPWADFRSYMDSSLATALALIRTTSHAVDPRTPVGIEGTQMPSAWGGYDLWKLSQVVDWVEPYDIGSAREIFGSFMPGKPIVATVFETETNPASRRLWHLLLEGDKGCIIWWSEDCIDWESEDYALTPKANALAPVLKEMRSPLAGLFLRAEREQDPIALHYSQPSIQADWLIESTVDGATWIRRFSSHEAQHNRMAKVRGSWLKMFQDLGFTPRFVSDEQLVSGVEPLAALVLPTSLAMSDAVAEAIGKLRDGGTMIFSDGQPGHFNEHARLRGASALPFLPVSASEEASHAVVKGVVNSRAGDVAGYGRERLEAAPEMAWAEWARTNLTLRAPVQAPLDSRTRVHRYRLGGERLIALERNITYQMSEELKQAGGNESLEKPVEVEVVFVEGGHVYDLRSDKYLGETKRVKVTIDPWRPTLLAITREKVEGRGVVSYLGGLVK